MLDRFFISEMLDLSSDRSDFMEEAFISLEELTWCMRDVHVLATLEDDELVVVLLVVLLLLLDRICERTRAELDPVTSPFGKAAVMTGEHPHARPVRAQNSGSFAEISFPITYENVQLLDV